MVRMVLIFGEILVVAVLVGAVSDFILLSVLELPSKLVSEMGSVMVSVIALLVIVEMVLKALS